MLKLKVKVLIKKLKLFKKVGVLIFMNLLQKKPLLFVLPGDSLIKGLVNTIKTQVYFHKSTSTVHIRYCAELRGPNEGIKRSPKLYR